MSTKTIDAGQYDTDKADHAHYLRNYEQYFRPLWGKDIRLFELGVFRGGSLLMWRDHFERGLIVGLDVEPVRVEDPSGRIRVYQGQQQDTALLDRIAGETAPEGFDVIIDDCSHVGELARVSFWHLFEHHLKPGGLYATHDYGMVGFVKELVDELAMPDITHPEFGIPPQRPSRFREMKLSQSHLIVVKA